VRNLTDPTSSSTLNDGRRRSGQSIECREALLIDVIGEGSEKGMETTCSRNVRIDSKTWTNIHSLDGLKVIHLIRNILTSVQIIDGLTIWKAGVGLEGLLERLYSLLLLETPVAISRTKVWGHYFQIEIVGRVVCWGCHEIRVTAGNRPGDWRQISLTLGRGRLVTLTVSKSLSGIYKTHDCCKSKRIHY
jgi:hypothetical protein